MNIIYDHQIFSKKEYGGIARYFYELSIHMIKMGNNVKITAPIYVCKYLDKNKNYIDGIRINKFLGSGEIIKFFNNVILKSPFYSYDPVDIFHETYFSRINNCPKNTARVITIYDMIHEKYPKYFSRIDAAKTSKKFATKRADHIICISKYTKQDLIYHYGVSEEKISVVYVGYMKKKQVNKFCNKLSLSKPYFLYVGARTGYKNFERLLKSYVFSSKLKNEFCLVCFGGGSFSKKEKRLFSNYKLNDSDITYFSGSDTVLSNLYENAVALVYPSLYEGFGIPPLEAMSHGCPVICSNVSSIPEVVGQAAEFFIPSKTESIQSTLEQTLFDSQKLSLLKEKGYKRSKLFSWEKCAKQTFDVYQKIT